MKEDDVPQHSNPYYEGEKKAVYAVDSNGKLIITQTAGWDVETEVLEQAIHEIDRLSKAAHERGTQGQSSSLEYHMYHQRMDIPMLAQATGFYQWQIKRHMQPKVFSRLSETKLALYAQVLGISLNEMLTLPDD